MTQEELLYAESLQRQHLEVLRYDNERYYLALQYEAALMKTLGCKLSKDGEQWCCLYGKDLQEGIAGFGKTPAEAISNWYREFGYN